MKPHVSRDLPHTQQNGEDNLSIGSYGGGSDQEFPGQGMHGFNWWFNSKMPSGEKLFCPRAAAYRYRPLRSPARHPQRQFAERRIHRRGTNRLHGDSDSQPRHSLRSAKLAPAQPDRPRLDSPLRSAQQPLFRILICRTTANVSRNLAVPGELPILATLLPTSGI